MKKRAVIAASAMLLMAVLAGCSVPADSTARQPSESTSPAPLTAESPAASTDEGEQAFLDYVRANLPANTVIPDATDEQLLAAGAEACDVLESGVDTSTVSLIEGEPKNGLGYYTDSGTIITGASINICG